MRSFAEFIKENEELLYRVHADLCKIPAPSHNEEKRAEYVKAWLESIGAEGVYIDEAKNAVFPLNCEESGRITVIVAHTDTVFPDTEPMPFHDDGVRIHCPGAGDDTASLAVMLLGVKYCIENEIKPEGGILFVANSCEEGLGNLKGIREIFKAYEGRIEKLISFDSAQIGRINDVCVGSHRYEVSVKTEGGHSFGFFGNDNAIHKLAEIISKIYSIKVPEREGTKTTYNVGIISGGTSINTIAENASMLCEYRSNDNECLEIMEKRFADIFAAAQSEKIKVSVQRVGDRPCAKGLDKEKQDALLSFLAEKIESVIGQKVTYAPSSTDCNIPMSLGIPAACISVYQGGGNHTRAEWIEKASLPKGLEIALNVITSL